jgi:hypothetical protein
MYICTYIDVCIHIDLHLCIHIYYVYVHTYGIFIRCTHEQICVLVFVYTYHICVYIIVYVHTYVCFVILFAAIFPHIITVRRDTWTRCTCACRPASCCLVCTLSIQVFLHCRFVEFRTMHTLRTQNVFTDSLAHTRRQTWNSACLSCSFSCVYVCTHIFLCLCIYVCISLIILNLSDDGG